MSTVKANNVQVGQSGTASQNFTLYQPSTPDGTVRLAVGNSGATTGDVLSVSSTGLSVTGTLTSTGVNTFPAGSASAPSITTTGDTNTGVFFPAADTAALSTGGSERMRITSGGALLVGTTSTSDNNAILQISSTTSGGVGGSLVIRNGASNAASNSAELVFKTSSGFAAGFNSAKIAAIQTTSAEAADLAFYTYGSGTGTERMRITSGGNLLVGTTTNNASGGVIQVSNGITFPATQSASTDANTLDDYEEGTWTPALKFGGNSTGMTISATGKYTKIGNVVYWTCDFVLTAKGSSTGSATITGLPFTSFNGTYSPAVVWAYDMSSLTGSIIYRVTTNATTIDIYQYDATGSNNALTQANFNNASQNRAAGFYFI